MAHPALPELVRSHFYYQTGVTRQGNAGWFAPWLKHDIPIDMETFFDWWEGARGGQGEWLKTHGYPNFTYWGAAYPRQGGSLAGARLAVREFKAWARDARSPVWKPLAVAPAGDAFIASTAFQTGGQPSSNRRVEPDGSISYVLPTRGTLHWFQQGWPRSRWSTYDIDFNQLTGIHIEQDMKMFRDGGASLAGYEFTAHPGMDYYNGDYHVIDNNSDPAIGLSIPAAKLLSGEWVTRYCTVVEAWPGKSNAGWGQTVFDSLAANPPPPLAEGGGNTPPTVSITSPAADSTPTSPIVISGVAADDVGVNRVEIDIHRTHDGASEWWNGAGYVPTFTRVLANGTTNWNYTFDIPVGKGGTHVLTPLAFEQAGVAAGTYTIGSPVTFAPEVSGTPPTDPPPVTYTHANTRYVATTGSNANNGTSVGTPWQTIQHAIDNSPADTLIHVASGNYNTNLIIRNKTNITLLGDLNNKPHITGTAYSVLEIGGGNTSHITIDSFKITATTTGGGNHGSPIGVNAQVVSAGSSVHHLTFRRNRLIGNTSSPAGIHIFNFAGASSCILDYITIEDNEISGAPGGFLGSNSSIGPSGISMFRFKAFDSAPGVHNVIRRNFIHHVAQFTPSSGIGQPSTITDGNGIIFDYNTSNGYLHRTDVYDNIIAVIGGSGTHTFESRNEVNVFNNTFVDCNRNWSYNLGTIGLTGSNQRAWNNIIIGGDASTFTSFPSNGAAVWGPNLAWQTNGSGNHTIVRNPLLANPLGPALVASDFAPTDVDAATIGATASQSGIASPERDYNNAADTLPWFGGISTIALRSSSLPPIQSSGIPPLANGGLGGAAVALTTTIITTGMPPLANGGLGGATLLHPGLIITTGMPPLANGGLGGAEIDVAPSTIQMSGIPPNSGVGGITTYNNQIVVYGDVHVHYDMPYVGPGRLALGEVVRIFIPPAIEEGGSGACVHIMGDGPCPVCGDAATRRLVRHLNAPPRPQTVLRIGSQWVTASMPTEEEIASASVIYTGGHRHVLEPSEAAALVDAGFDVDTYFEEAT